jgi:hypothetical protein
MYNEGSSDMYIRGKYAAYFTTNCKWWWKMENYIKRFKQYFYHQTVTTKQIEDYLSSAVGIDLEPFFSSVFKRYKSTYIRILLQRQYS